MDESEDRLRWRFDKRIPIGTVTALLAQAAVILWAAAGLWSAVDEHSRRIAAIEAQRAGERLAVLESTIGDVRAQLNRIEAKLDRYAEKTGTSP